MPDARVVQRAAGRTVDHTPRGRGRLPGIDALRGVAIGLVMLHHALPGPFPGAGVVGVVMFFALSGYLITGVLVGEQAASGRIDLRRFYLRRARRLVPAMVVMLVVLSAVTLLLDPLGDRGELGRTLLFALTWTGDLPFGHASDATFHLWTLAAEEQFYLVWPGLLLLGGAVAGRARAVGTQPFERAKRVLRHRPTGGSPGHAGVGGGAATVGRRRTVAGAPPGRVGRVGRVAGAVLALRIAGAASAVACLATCWWLRSAPDAAYSLPTVWAGCFVIGGAARVSTRSPGRPARPPGTRPTARAVVGVLAVLGVLCVIPLRGHIALYLLGGPAIAALTCVLLLAWRTWTPTGPTGAAGRALVALGTVSYAAYLWNYPLTLWLRPLGVAGGLLAAMLTLVAAALSWRYVEQPLTRRRTPAPTP